MMSWQSTVRQEDRRRRNSKSGLVYRRKLNFTIKHNSGRDLWNKLLLAERRHHSLNLTGVSSCTTNLTFLSPIPTRRLF
jgi:hypothetical protein